MARIGVISAMSYELPDVIPYSFSKGIRTVKKRENALGVVVSGVGCGRAEKATELLCREFRPDVLVMLGFCGCADSAIAVGTLIVADTLHYNGRQESLDSAELKEVRELLAASSVEHTIGNFQTFDHPVLSNEPVLKGVTAVDMEAFAVVKKAREWGVKPCVVKAVSDMLPMKEPVFFPTLRLQFRIYRNFMTAKKGLNDLGKIWFK